MAESSRMLGLGKQDAPLAGGSSRDYPGYKLTESLVPASARVPSHSHDEPHVTLTVSGECRETYRTRTHDLVCSATTYFHPGESHKLEVARGGAFLSFDIGIDQRWLQQMLPRPLISPPALLSNPSSNIPWLAFRLYGEFRRPDQFSGLATRGLVLEILAELGRCSNNRGPRPPAWLHRVCQMMHDEQRTTISLSELAACAGVHPSHLVEVFRKHKRCTPGEYMRRLRIDASIRAMADPGRSLADISIELGFTDQSHFSRVFKQTTGMTPAQFRRLRLGIAH